MPSNVLITSEGFIFYYQLSINQLSIIIITVQLPFAPYWH